MLLVLQKEVFNAEYWFLEYKAQTLRIRPLKIESASFLKMGMAEVDPH